MILAIINTQTNIVENVAVAPSGAWSPPVGFIAIETETAAIGDIYDPETNAFNKPQEN